MKKKKFLILLVLVLLIGALVGGYFYFSRNGSNSFNSKEEQWLESNKNNVVDIYLPRDIASLTYMGEGMFFDFLTSLERKTNLNFQEVAYETFSDVSSKEYAIELVDEVAENQIAILNDNYVLITKEKKVYTSPEEFPTMTVGILKSDQENIQKYLSVPQITYVAYETKDSLWEAFQAQDSTLTGVIGLKTLSYDQILTHDYHIAYHLLELSKTYVLSLRGEDTLNSIISKTYQNWYKDKFKESYYENILDTYFNFKNVTEKERTTLREKSYIYAFVESGAYDKITNKELMGINYSLIKGFAEFANIDMEYQKGYSGKEALLTAFQEGKVDFFFNPYSGTVEKGYATVEPIRSNTVILSPVEQAKSISTLASLQAEKVLAVRGTKIEKYLLDHGITPEVYDSVTEMLKHASKDTLIATDLENYEYYKTNQFASYKISYLFTLDSNYGYMVQEEDKLFAQLFDFYLEYMPIQSMVNESYSQIFTVERKEVYYLVTIAVLAFIVVVQFLHNAKRVFAFFKKRRKKNLTKDEKIRYIDSLTSLKNRAYLNDNIEKWDNSEVYPQIIIIVDLNNIAYINDNFGHEEGDKVITEAANILIQTQMPRSEIIRTDGNEFLIYLVEYEEKQAVSYIRKLNKELKELSHGFGAATGYSVINDAIKTIDDAVNEATLDMRTNKEAMVEEEKQ